MSEGVAPAKSKSCSPQHWEGEWLCVSLSVWLSLWLCLLRSAAPTRHTPAPARATTRHSSGSGSEEEAEEEEEEGSESMARVG